MNNHTIQEGTSQDPLQLAIALASNFPDTEKDQHFLFADLDERCMTRKQICMYMQKHDIPKLQLWESSTKTDGTPHYWITSFVVTKYVRMIRLISSLPIDDSFLNCALRPDREGNLAAYLRITEKGTPPRLIEEFINPDALDIYYHSDAHLDWFKKLIQLESENDYTIQKQ